MPPPTPHGQVIDSMIDLFLTSSIVEKKPEIVPIAAPRDPALPKIPCEIWSRVLDHLDVQDVMSLRLAGRTWAFVGQEHLFKTFVMRPNRDDFQNFEFIAQSPVFKSTKAVRFEIGTLNVNYAVENLAYAYLEKNNEIRAIGPEVQSKLDLDRQKQEAMEEYAAWNSRWHEAQQDFREAGPIQELFSRIDTLDRVEMAYKACPFRSELLMNAWIQGTHGHAFRRTVKEFRAVLSALKRAESHVKHFSHDSLPWIFFTPRPAELLQIVSPLEGLESIRLTFDSTETPHAKFWSGLGIVLKSMPKLKDIRIGFAPFQSGYTDDGTWQDALNSANWYVPLQSMLGDFTWKELRNLRLDGLVLCEDGLSAFFDRHPAIRVLELYNIALWQGSFQSLLTSVVFMQLRKFRMWGCFSAFNSIEESWRVDPGYDTEIEGWSPVFKNFLQRRAAEDKKLFEANGNICPDRIRSNLESFVLGEIHWYGVDPWPLSRRNGIIGGHAHLGCKRTHNYYCSIDRHSGRPGCPPRSPEAMHSNWKLLIETPISSLRDYRISDLPGVGEPKFAPFYHTPALIYLGINTPPIDMFGFDRAGFLKGTPASRGCRPKDGKLNRAQYHIRDLMDYWSSKPSDVKAADAYRMMMKGVLDLITRYQVESKRTRIPKDMLNTTPQNARSRHRTLILGRVGSPGPGTNRHRGGLPRGGLYW